jgi:hypothetical protein
MVVEINWGWLTETSPASPCGRRARCSTGGRSLLTGSWRGLWRSRRVNRWKYVSQRQRENYHTNQNRPCFHSDVRQ